MAGSLTDGARRRRAAVGLVLAMFLGGLGGTWASTVAVQRVEQRHAGQLMDRYADDISQAVRNEAGRYHDTLINLAVAVGAQSDLTAADFAEITSGLNRERLPGASNAIFAVASDDGQIPEVQARWRAHGATDLRLAPVGTGLEHVFVVFNRPLDGSTPALGRDLSQAAEPADALRAARDSGEVTASRTYVLLKDRDVPAAQQQMSFLLAAPVLGGAGTPDAGRFRGWVFLSMRGGDFIAETLKTRSQGAVSVTLLDLSGDRPRTVVTPPSTPTPRTALLDQQRTVAVGQRTWQLRMTATDTLLGANDRRMPAIVFGAGTVMTVLLSALVGVLISTRNRAMTKVEQATAALRDDIERRKHTEARLRERESELRHRASHDPLTGVANRALLHHRVEQALHTHDRPGTTFAVLFIDLDGFKQVNDRHGHNAGDTVLTEVAKRLRASVRAGDTVARLGGDEFAVLAEHLTAPENAETVADHVIQALQAPIHLDGGPVRVTASVGVAYRLSSACTTDTILRRADTAMYHAKTSGKDRYHVTDAPTHRPVTV